MIIHNPNGPPPNIPAPPSKPVPSGNTKPLGTSPGLVTSKGGLYGVNGVLFTPLYDTGTGRSFVVIHDASNFSCEEAGEYDFPQVIPGNPPQEGRSVTCHLIILKYRELGIASFSVNVTVYTRETDSFTTVQIPVAIPILPLRTKQRKQNFPDGKIHTVRLYPPNGEYITGERPQVSVTYNASSGPFSVTSLILCGNADETVQA